MRARLSARVAAVRLPLRTRRLLLVAHAADHDDELVALLKDPEVSKWTTIPFPYARRDAREFRRRSAAGRRAGTDLALQIVRRSDGVLLGGVGLHLFNVRRSSVELGYWIGRPYRRQGFVSEAVERVLKLAYRDLGVHRVEAHVLVGNRASSGVLRKAGFVREGRFAQSWPVRGGFRDELLYARLAGPPSRRAAASRPASPGRTRKNAGRPGRARSRRERGSWAAASVSG